jgi:acyl-CoA synthetase (AMP-forming)/AMP-acid ligase II
VARFPAVEGSRQDQGSRRADRARRAYADDAAPFGPALDALGGVTAVTAWGDRPGTETISDLRATEAGPAVRGAFGTLNPDVIAKVLFTSGSTGTPKGVPGSFARPDLTGRRSTLTASTGRATPSGSRFPATRTRAWSSVAGSRRTSS